MTGNIVFLGLGIAGASGFSIVSPAVAVAGFVVGAVVGGRLCHRPGGGHRARAVRDVTAFKAVLALPVTAVVVVAAEPLHPAVRLVVTALLAASMGGQLSLIRYLKVPDLLTAVLTLTTIGVLTEHGGGRHDPLVLRRGLALAAFVAGVVAAACWPGSSRRARR
nr:DUF1275 family protein [Actinomycetospora sp. NBRC 106375]